MATNTYVYCTTCNDAPTIHTCPQCGACPLVPCWCPGCGPQCGTHPNPALGNNPHNQVGTALCTTHPQHPAPGPALVAWLHALLPLCNRPGNPTATRHNVATVLQAARIVARHAHTGPCAPVAGGCPALAHTAALAAGTVACAMCHQPHTGCCAGGPTPGPYTRV